MKTGDTIVAKRDHFELNPKIYDKINGYGLIQLLTKGKRYHNIIIQKSKITAGDDIHFIHDDGKSHYWVMYSALENFDVIPISQIRKLKLNKIVNESR